MACIDTVESTYTPAENTAGVTISASSGKFVKIGAVVYAYGTFHVDGNVSGASVKITLPTNTDGTDFGYVHGTMIRHDTEAIFTISQDNNVVHWQAGGVTFSDVSDQDVSFFVSYIDEDFV